MKQTVEKASIEYAESVIRSFGTCGVPNGISDIKEMIANGFNSGRRRKLSKPCPLYWRTGYMAVMQIV